MIMILKLIIDGIASSLDCILPIQKTGTLISKIVDCRQIHLKQIDEEIFKRNQNKTKRN